MKKILLILMMIPLFSGAVTRFYMPATGTSAVTPAIGGTWTASGSSIIRPIYPTKTSTTMAGTSITVDNSSGTASTLFYRGVSQPLAAQTISGTVKGQFRMNLNNVSGATCVSRIVITVVNSAGTVVATILGATSGGSNLTTTLTNRITPVAGTALTSYACAAGDRIVVEVGIIRTAGTTSRTGTISFGEDSGTDLPEDNAATAANNPWVEFSGDIKFNATSQMFMW